MNYFKSLGSGYTKAFLKAIFFNSKNFSKVNNSKYLNYASRDFIFLIEWLIYSLSGYNVV